MKRIIKLACVSSLLFISVVRVNAEDIVEEVAEDISEQVIEEKDEQVLEEIIEEVVEEKSEQSVLGTNETEISTLDNNTITLEKIDSGIHEGVIWELYSDNSVIIKPNNYDGVMNTRLSASEVMSADKIIVEEGVMLPNYSPYNNNKGIFESYLASSIEFKNSTENLFSMYQMFYDMKNLVHIDFGSSFNTENVVSMFRMFEGVTKLETLDLSSFNTSKVTNMVSMFSDMQSLVSLDISSFNTENVESMRRMFYKMGNLQELDLSNFNTGNVNNMGYMFQGNYELKKLDLSSFDTQKVTDMASMFSNCSKLEELYISNFDTSRVRRMDSMFNGLIRLKELDVSNFETNRVTDMKSMFDALFIISELDVSDFDTSNVTDMSYMFDSTRNLNSLDLSSFNTSNVKTMTRMFDSSAVVDLDLTTFNTSKVTSMDFMFSHMPNLKQLNISSFDTSNVTTMYKMFRGTSEIEYINVDNFNTNSLEDISYMFENMKNIDNLDLSKFDTSNVKLMTGLFSGASSLSNLNLSNFSIESTNKLNELFAGTRSLKTVDISHFDTSNIQYMTSMFKDSGITSLDLSNFDTSKVENMNSLFEGANELVDLDISSFNTENVTAMQRMFKNASKLKALDLSHFNTDKVYYFTEIFYGLSSLEKLNISNFNTSNCITFNNMFEGLLSINEITLGEKSYFLKAINLGPIRDGRWINVMDRDINYNSFKDLSKYYNGTEPGTYILDYDVTLTFVLESGYKDIEVPYSSVVSESEFPNAEIEGFNLIGWNTQADGSGSYFIANETLVLEPTTIYPQYEQIEYTVNFYYGLGDWKSIEVAHGSIIDLLEVPDVTQEHKTFKGWNKNIDGTGEYVDISNHPIKNNLDIYAISEINEYSLRFIYGENEESIITKKYQSKIDNEDLPNEISVEGYNFIGWNDSGDGNGNYINFDDYTFVKDETVYAIYDLKNYKVVFDTLDEKIVELVDHGKTLDNKQIPKDPMKAGYIFTGWTLNGEAFAYNEYKVMEDLYIKANYVVDTSSEDLKEEESVPPKDELPTVEKEEEEEEELSNPTIEDSNIKENVSTGVVNNSDIFIATVIISLVVLFMLFKFRQVND